MRQCGGPFKIVGRLMSARCSRDAFSDAGHWPGLAGDRDSGTSRPHLGNYVRAAGRMVKYVKTAQVVLQVFYPLLWADVLVSRRLSETAASVRKDICASISYRMLPPSYHCLEKSTAILFATSGPTHAASSAMIPFRVSDRVISSSSLQVFRS